MLAVEAGVTVAVARHLALKGRPTSALTMGAAWAGSLAPHVVLHLALSLPPPGIGFAWGAARIAPPLRLPIAMEAAAWSVLWRRRHSGPVSVTGKALASAIVGAAIGTTVAEHVASAARAGAGHARRRPVAIVVNRHAGSSRLARRAVRALHREGVVVLFEHEATGSDLERVLERAVGLLPPHGRLVVAGGDGTIGRAAALAADAGRSLAILPTGTGNDVARSLGLSMHPEEAAALAAWGAMGSMDLGEAGANRFAHALTLGMTADFANVVRDVHGWRRPLVYPIRAWQVWRRRAYLDVAIQVDGVDLAMMARPFQVAIVNAPRIGGRVGVNLPAASPYDGNLDVIAVYRGALLHSAAALIDLLRSGQAKTPAGALLGAGRRVEISSRSEYPCAFDGELMGRTPLSVRAVPAALRVALPRASQVRHQPP